MDTVGQLTPTSPTKATARAKAWPFSIGGGFFSRDKKDTSLYSNDGGTGCTTCGYNNPALPECSDWRVRPVAISSLG